MPYSESQRTLARIALSMKRGKTPKSYSKAAAEMCASMTEAQLIDFAESRIKKKR